MSRRMSRHRSMLELVFARCYALWQAVSSCQQRSHTRYFTRCKGYETDPVGWTFTALRPVPGSERPPPGRGPYRETPGVGALPKGKRRRGSSVVAYTFAHGRLWGVRRAKPGRARLCLACGTRSRGTAGGARPVRSSTVVFSDLAGSTSLGERWTRVARPGDGARFAAIAVGAGAPRRHVQKFIGTR